jgi:hypothetical protein
MVYVFIPPARRQAVEATREELATLRELRARGLEGESLERALVAGGIPAERARLLAAVGSPQTAASVAGRLVLMTAVMALGLLFALAERPMRHWLRDHYPGWEWLVGLVFPLVVIVVVLWRIQSRRRAAADAPEGTTRADQIDNRPIG